MRPVNLLPEEHRRTRGGGDGGYSAQIVIGVLAALVVMAGLYAVFTNKANSKKTEAAEARQETSELTARADALGAFGDFAQVERNRSASVRSLASVRFDWERFMRELSLVTPRGTWLTEANSSATGQLTGEGGTSSSSSTSSSSGGAAGQPLANLKGCAPRQSEVAKLMVRLRRLYRVTDVKLNESSREANTGTASLESCGRYLKFDVLVTFGPTPTSGEGPGENKSVPATLGGGS
jgi:hypothetical protein